MHNPGTALSKGSCQVVLSYDKGKTWVVIQASPRGWTLRFIRLPCYDNVDIRHAHLKNPDPLL